MQSQAIHFFFYPFLMGELHLWAHPVKCWRSAEVYSHYSRNGNKLSEIYGLEINSAEGSTCVDRVHIPKSEYQNLCCNRNKHSKDASVVAHAIYTLNQNIRIPAVIEINSAKMPACSGTLYIPKWGFAYRRNRTSPFPWNFDKLLKIKLFTYAIALRITRRERIRKASPGDP